MLERLTKNQQALVGLVSAVVIALFATLGVKAAFGEFDDGYELTARFGGAGQNLGTAADVKIRGVNVGEVLSVELDEEGRALVTMRIQPDVEVPETSLAAVRPISVFGPKFIELVPGADEGEGPFFENGDEIERTVAPIELNDVLEETSEVLEAIDPEDLTIMLRTFADGIDGLATEISQSLTDGQTVLDALVASSEDRRAFLTNLALLSEELADQGETIVGIGENTHQFAPDFNAHGDDFAALLEGTSQLSSDLAAILDANSDVLGPATAAGARLAGITAADLEGMIGYLRFVRTYSTELDRVISAPVTGQAFIMATQQFLMSTNPCEALVNVPECDAPAIDPGPQATGGGP